MATALKPERTDSFGWSFERNAPMGGAAGEAYTNTLASSGMPPAAVLAREAIQNSVDAKAGAERKVAVEFVGRELLGSDKKSFVATSQLAGLAARSERLGLPDPNCLLSIDDDEVPLRLLYINDYNTTGLAGDPSDADSKFYRFLLSLGDGGKEHEEHGTGGSYGFGKSVYSSNSSILTIFAYSRTRDEADNPIRLTQHLPHNEKKRTGRSKTGTKS